MVAKKKTLGLIAFLGCVVAGIMGLQSLFDQVPGAVSEFSVRVSGRQPPLMNRCASCHQDACKEFENAPHSRTLFEASDPLVLGRFAGRSFQISKDGPTVRFEERNGQLWMASDAYPEPMRIEWMFGSGTHAMTPVSLLSNPDGATELIEGSVSWFPPNDLGPTPGADLSGSPGVRSLGEPINHATTMECFGCHVTQLPHDEGRIRQDAIIKGVSCDRCHPGGDQHIAAMEHGAAGLLEKWSELSPLESNNRCGECHRRADQLTSSELSPERTVLVRFAPVGIAMSACFAKQDSLPSGEHSFRMDCMTCHDPHKPAEKSAEYYVAKCLHCHGPEEHQASQCSSAATSAECLTCHMPTVSVTANLNLTDHWIRVRKPSDLAPARLLPQ
jgi:hypothetical protein